MADEKQTSNRCYLYTRLLIANLPALTCGMMISWPSPVLPKLKVLDENNPLGYIISTTETAAIGSLLSFGAIFGPQLAPYLQEKFGRKNSLVIFEAIFIAGLLTLAFAKHIALYYTARLLIGLSYGGVYTILPVYLVEFAGNRSRGAVINASSILTVVGAMLSYSIGPFTSIMVYTLICASIPVVFMILFLTLMPETPQDLILMGKEEKAKEMFLRINLGNEKDFDDVKESITTKIKTPYKEIFQNKTNIKILGIIFMLVTLKQFCGNNVITSYTQDIFKATSSDLPSEFPPIIIEATSLLVVFIVPYFVENVGRKFLLICSTVGMSISFTAIGVYFHLEPTHDVSSLSWLPIICLIGSKASYCFGFMSVIWILMAEMLPYNVKNVGSAIVNSFCWGMLFLATFAFPIITNNTGLDVSFWIFAGVNVFALFFALLVIPETKGKSAQEIQEMLK